MAVDNGKGKKMFMTDTDGRVLPSYSCVTA